MKRLLHLLAPPLALSLALLTPAHATSQEFPLTNKAIIIGAQATEPEAYAAEELQRALKAMTGVELPIERANNEPRDGFHIGTPSTAPFIGKALFTTGDEEELRIVKKGERITLAGPTPRAALYATYAFLEETLGVRWLWPGESGEFIPAKERLELPPLDIRQTPDIEHRSLVITWVRHGYDEPTDIWMARNRLNGIFYTPGNRFTPEMLDKRKEKGFLQRLGGHNAILPEAVLKKHPEYIALVGGERRPSPPGMRAPQLCWSNPAVVDAMAEQMLRWCKEHPYIDIISFIPSDHSRYCECPPCTGQGNVSERWQRFSAQVIEKVKAGHPSMRFWSLAYMGYRDAPDHNTIAPFDTLGYALYNGCYRHDPAKADPIADKPAEEIRQWQKTGAKVGIRGYEYILPKDPAFIPLVSWQADQFRWADSLKLNSYSSEIPPYNYPADKPAHEQAWTTNRMNVYTAAKSAWNTGLGAREIVRDWVSTLYGSGAEAMEQYYWLMDDAWRKAPADITLFGHPLHALAREFITPELLHAAGEAIHTAEQAIKKNETGQLQKRALEQIALERQMLEAWSAHYQFQLNHLGQWEVTIPKASTPLDTETAWQTAATLAPFEDKKEEIAPDATDVKMVWDDEGLHIDILCHDPNTSSIAPLYRKHDQNLYSDESIEIFLKTEPETNGYMHLIVNTAGAQYDARTEGGGMDFDRSWNPAWKATTTLRENAWAVSITLPFSSFSVTPKEGMLWKFAIKRTRPQTTGKLHSGWPDASYHSPGAFGTLKFATTAPAPAGRLILLDTHAKSEGVKIEFLKQTWQITVVNDGEALSKELQSNPTGVLLRWMPGSPITAQQWQDALLPYLRMGGRMIIAGAGHIPFQRWLGHEEFNVAWSGWEMDPLRHTSSFKEGAWMRHPHDLESIITRRVTPSSGYTPLNESWSVLASSKQLTGEEVAYLLHRPVGQGALYLTSSGLGYSGGHEMFGHLNTMNVVHLLENLFSRETPDTP